MPNDTATQRRPRLAKSQQAVLDVLEADEWSCGVDFGQAFVGWSFASRISEMRSLGLKIESRRCHRHAHRTAVIEYRLEDGGPSESDG